MSNKRSISTSDSALSAPSTEIYTPNKKQKTTDSPSSSSLFRRAMGIFGLAKQIPGAAEAKGSLRTDDAAQDTSSGSTVGKVYPALPEPYTAQTASSSLTTLSADENAEAGDAAHPIDLVDDDDEGTNAESQAGPSRLPWSAYPVERAPSRDRSLQPRTPHRRPNLSTHDSPARTYVWATSSSSSQDIKVEQRRRQAARIRKSAVRKPKIARIMQSAKETLSSVGRRKEEAYRLRGGMYPADSADVRNNGCRLTEGLSRTSRYE